MNVPSEPLTVSRNIPVAWLRTTTVTPGRTAPCASCTRPRSSVVPCCADAPAATSIASVSRIKTRFIRTPPTCNSIFWNLSFRFMDSGRDGRAYVVDLPLLRHGRTGYTGCIQQAGCRRTDGAGVTCDVRISERGEPKARGPPLHGHREMATHERLFHQPAAASVMLFHACACAGGIVTRDRFDDLKVRLGRALLEWTEADTQQHESIDLREAALDQLERQIVARALRNREVKLDVRGFRDAVVLQGHDRHGGQPAETLHLIVTRQSRRARGGRPFEQASHVEGVVDL